jgi:peptidoglycan/xylan/chitin deacetylase (PgdA/CDA1 family)
LGIWQEFATSHPEFPVRATFFVLPDTLWGQRSMLPAKLALLSKLGCELGNHSMTHPILRKLPDDKVKWEIGEAQERLEKLGVAMPCSLALPFGVSPKNKALLAGFDFDGRHIAPKAVFLVGANPAPAPSSSKFNRLRIPRIQAYDGPLGLKYWLDEVEKGRVKLYVTG